MPDTVSAFVGVGSNQHEPARQVLQAMDELDRLPATRVDARSGLYESRPWGFTRQPNFINAVVALRTGLAPRALLEELLALERHHGRHRERTRRWGPRSLDLDLLLYDDRVVREEGLVLPHPRLHERAFVLRPLMELAPDCMIPGRGRVRDLLRMTDDTGVWPWSGEPAEKVGCNTDS